MAESEITEGSAEHGSWQALDNCECCEASCYTRCIAFLYKCGEWSHNLTGIIASTCEFVNYVRRPCGMESFTLNMFLTMIYFFPCCNLPRGPRFFCRTAVYQSLSPIASPILTNDLHQPKVVWSCKRWNLGEVRIRCVISSQVFYHKSFDKTLQKLNLA